MLGQVRQRRQWLTQRSQRLKQRSQKLADVITYRYTVLGKHGVDDLARIEHVRRDVWKGDAEGVLIGFTKACQQNGGEPRELLAKLKSLCLVVAMR